MEEMVLALAPAESGSHHTARVSNGATHPPTHKSARGTSRKAKYPIKDMICNEMRTSYGNTYNIVFSAGQGGQAGRQGDLRIVGTLRGFVRSMYHAGGGAA